jgi:PAS domain S-box-containing protein
MQISELERYKLFCEVTTQAIFISKDGKCIFQNRMAEKLFGYTQEEVIGKDAKMWVDEKYQKLVERNIKKNYTEKYEAVAVKKNGTKFSCELQGFLKEYKNETVRVTILKDISEQKKLKDSQQILLNHIPLQIWYLIDEKTYGLVNQAHADFLGMEIEDVSFKNIYNLFDKKSAEKYYLNNKFIFQTKSSQCREEWTENYLGELRLLNITKTPKLNDKNEIEYIIVTAEDITLKKKIEQQLIQNQKLESINRLIDGISKEFNNMLGVIKGFTDLTLLEQNLPPQIEKNLKKIDKNIDRSHYLIKQLLSFSKKQEINPIILDINTIIDSLFKFIKTILGNNITLKKQLCYEPWLVNFDPNQLNQILMNLCVNAKEAIDPNKSGEILISTNNINIDEEYCKNNIKYKPGEYIVLSIRDNGTGIDKENLNKIFEPFFTTKNTEGVGLGLSAVYGIIEQNNGFIVVYSEIDKGTVFKIYLPRYKEEKQLLDKSSKINTLIKNKTLLIVDDEESMLYLLKQILKNQNYTILLANSYDKAKIFAKEYAGLIDLLITDINLGHNQTGVQLSNDIEKYYPLMKTFYISGDLCAIDNYEEVNSKNILFKPFDFKEFNEKIQKLLK